MRLALSSLFGLLACATAGDALAQFQVPMPGYCRRPSAALCADDAYQRTFCARQYRRHCSDLLLDAAEANAANAPVAETVNADGDLIDARVMPHDQQHLRVYGFDGRFAGDSIKQQMNGVDAAGYNWALFGQQIQRARWADNGNAVDSCAEYVHERWYGYSTYEDAAAELGDDWRGAHDMAWESGALGDWLYSKDRRRSFRRPWLSKRRGRNAFANARPDAWQAYTELLRDAIEDHPALWDRQDDITLHDYDAALTAQVDRARYSFTETWDWHRRANLALADESDAVLIYLEDKADEFARTVVARDLAEARVVKADIAYNLAESRCRGVYFNGRYVRGGDCVDMEPLADELVDALNALGRADAAVEAGLREGQTLGCLEDETIGRCDWSPRALVLALEGHYMTEREEDFDRCARVTSEDFDRLRDARWLRDAYCDALSCRYMSWPTNFATGTYWVDQYMTRAMAWVDALDLPVDPATGAPMIAESAQDSGSSGDGRFGVSFDYTLGWNVSDLVEGGEANTCEADLAVTGTVNVEATAFGYSTGGHRPSLFDATFALVADGEPGDDGYQDVDLNASVIVFGNAFDPIELEDTAFHFADDLQHSGDLTPRVSMAAPIAGIPLTLRGWMSGLIGARYSVDGGVERNCNRATPTVDVGLRATFEPYAAVNGHATASLDFYIVDVGVGVDLNIIDLALPFHAAVAMRMGPGLAELTAEAGLALDIGSLAGRIKVFVEPFIGDGWQKTLFAWKGIRDTVTLFGEEYSYPIEQLANLLAARE